ncbi:MAG: hypothetical protein DA405_08160 [Bacteroidetes bacterium]|nr:MAG: hypothetical protein DA405_08160 [Bacteroidota bacterium]
MKIRKISLENINSLRGKWDLDFTDGPLSASRLFAITGPTGSGKSTILDVITLALFNRVPRLGKVSKNFVAQSGALLSRNTDRAFASVEYECSNGIFRSSWEISLNRNGKLRDYEMEISDLSSHQILDLKKSLVPDKNEELIGLNYDQFVKSIMLAQGDFAEFLKVDKSKRGELLEKITGTGIYRELGKKAFEKKNQFAKVLEDLRKETAIHSEALLSNEQHLEQTNRASELEKVVLEKEQILKHLEEQINLHSELEKVQKSHLHKQEELNTDTQKLEAFKEREAAKIERHEATFAFADALEEWKRNGLEIHKDSHDLEAIKSLIGHLAQDQKNVLTTVEELLKRKVANDEVRPVLDRFQQQVEKLERQIEEKQQDYRAKRNELIARGENWGFSPRKDEPSTDLTDLQNLAEESEKEILKLSKELTGIDLEKHEEELQDLETKANALRQGKQWTEQKFKIVQGLEKEQNILQEKTSQAEALPPRIAALQKDEETGSLQVKLFRSELENQKLRASLEDHRAQLIEGEPCKLCGSIDHPWASGEVPTNDGLAADLQAAEKHLEGLSKELIQAEAERQNLEKEIAEIGTRIKTGQEEIAQLDQKLKEDCAEWLPLEPLDWSALIDRNLAQRGALKKYASLKLKLKGIKTCLPLLQAMQLILEAGKNLAAEKRSLFNGENIGKSCGDLRDAWQKIHHELDKQEGRQTSLSAELKTLTKTQSNLKIRLLPLLEEKGFESIEEALSRRLSEVQYQELQRQMSHLKSVQDKSATELKSLAKQQSEIQSKLSEEAKEVLLEKRANSNVELSTIRESWEEGKRLLKNHEDNLAKVAHLQKRIAEEEKTGRKWELLNKMIGDSNGKRFNDFAQDLSLQQLLTLANQRLVQLTDRYRIASPQGEEDDSLIAIDDHMGGQRRSVKTLSGGETFVLSLSLALALSDLASKNVEINSLFIDEGFGTLDPETLDQTLDTLERLQTESSKTIGIISHVEALKERISTQVQLHRNGQGYSSLKVVG